jgi:hypothetical protein
VPDSHFWITTAISTGQLILTYRQLKLFERTVPPAQQGLSRWLLVRRYWPILAMAVLAVSAWIPYLIEWPQPDYFIAWGRAADPLRVYAVVDGHKLLRQRPNELVLIARGENDTVDRNKDTAIVRSGTFEIFDRNIRIEAIVSSPETGLAMQKFSTEFYLLSVPQSFPLESVHSIAEAQQYGAKIVGAKGAY